jgi:hypothetical protein
LLRSTSEIDVSLNRFARPVGALWEDDVLRLRRSII